MRKKHRMKRNIYITALSTRWITFSDSCKVELASSAVHRVCASATNSCHLHYVRCSPLLYVAGAAMHHGFHRNSVHSTQRYSAVRDTFQLRTHSHEDELNLLTCSGTVFLSDFVFVIVPQLNQWLDSSSTVFFFFLVIVVRRLPHTLTSDLIHS